MFSKEKGVGTRQYEGGVGAGGKGEAGSSGSCGEGDVSPVVRDSFQSRWSISARRG